jgi:signal transduction histidine kinase
VVALYAELDAQAEQLQEGHRAQEPLPGLHEPRVPHADQLHPQHRAAAERPRRRPAHEEQEKQVGFIQQNATEFAEMVDDLLDLAKVEAGRVEISPAWFEMVDLFSALRGMFKPVLHQPGHLRVRGAAGLPKLYTDDRKLSQILRNFISNALKFTPRGEVRVTARASADDAVTFSVADTGIGIAPEFHAAIFEDFSQVQSPLQKRLRGTGLGLSLSKKLARCSAAAWAAERTGQGLGVLRDDPGAAGGAGRNDRHPTVINTTIDRSRHTVLVVDDNPATRYSTRRA